MSKRGVLFAPGKLVFISGDPGGGKSFFAASLGFDLVASNTDTAGIYFSADDDVTLTQSRFKAIVSANSYPAELGKVFRVKEKVNLSDFEKIAEKLREETGRDKIFFVLDYVQKIDPADAFEFKTYGNFVNAIKDIGKRNKILIFLLSQNTRAKADLSAKAAMGGVANEQAADIYFDLIGHENNDASFILMTLKKNKMLAAKQEQFFILKKRSGAFEYSESKATQQDFKAINDPIIEAEFKRLLAEKFKSDENESKNKGNKGNKGKKKTEEPGTGKAGEKISFLASLNGGDS